MSNQDSELKTQNGSEATSSREAPQNGSEPPVQLAELVDRARNAIPALTFAAAFLLMIAQTYVPGLETLGRARWLPVLLLCGIGGAAIAATRTLPRPVRRFDLCAAAFIAWAFLSSTYAIDGRATTGRTMSLAVGYFAIFWTIWPLEIAAHGYRRTLRAIAAAAAAVVILSYAIIPIIPRGAIVSQWRFQGIMESPNSLGTLVALTLPLVLWQAIGVTTRERTFWRVVSGLMIVAAQLSQSRTTAAAALIGGSYYLFHALPHRRRQLAVWVVCYIGLAAAYPQITWAYQEYLGRQHARQERSRTLADHQGALQSAARRVKQAQIALEHAKSQPELASQALLLERLERQIGEARLKYLQLKDSIEGISAHVALPRPSMSELFDLATNPRNINIETASGRTVSWMAGLQFLMERPLHGFGFGNEEKILPSRGFVEGQSVFFGFYFHNSYLGLALQVGLVGFLLFFVPIGMLTFREMRSAAGNDDASLRIALRGVLLTGLFIALFESWIYSMGNAITFSFWTTVMVLTWIRTRTGASAVADAAVARR